MEVEEYLKSTLAKKYFAAYCSVMIGELIKAAIQGQRNAQQFKEAEEIVIYLSDIIREFVDVLSFERIPGPAKQKVKEECEALVYYGFFTHCSVFPRPGRNNYSSIDTEALYSKWTVASLTVGSILSHYHRQANNFPLKAFALLYENKLEPLQKELGLGMWRRRGERAKFKNLFESGVLLGMMCDIEAAEQNQ